MSKTIKEISQIAAEWWADVIQSPKFDIGDDSSVQGLYIMLLAEKLVKPVSEESKKRFIEYLSNSIEKELNKGKKTIFIDVDYSPNFILSEAAKIAEISSNNFPYKTIMAVSSNHIEVKYGYTSEFKSLYSNKKYWQWKIDSNNKFIDAVKNGEIYYYIKDESERKKEETNYINDILKNIEYYKKCLEGAED
jgi:hypothetical protein